LHHSRRELSLVKLRVSSSEEEEEEEEVKCFKRKRKETIQPGDPLLVGDLSDACFASVVSWPTRTFPS
jgi:hypothetical protein